MAQPYQPPVPPFAVTRHGFDREQVLEHLRRVDAELQRALAGRTEAANQVAELTGQLQIAQREVAALSERLETLTGQQVPKAAHEQEIARMLQVATAQAGEITDRAQASADHTWSAAEEASAALRERYRTLLGDLERQHDELHGAHEQIMRSAQQQVTEMTTAAQQRRTEIDDAAEAERDRVEHEFQAEITSRRAALDAELDERQAVADRRAVEIVHTATELANRRITEVNADLTRLGEARNGVALRLQDARRLLDTDLLDPLPDEDGLTVAEGGERPVPDLLRAPAPPAPDVREPEPSA